ncbi:MAG: hypothetical protein HQK60_01720 [Deltaproteobacteria bacterium]|nr:hypothetical protein [Deltaproteobacteria bacterium]
MDLVVSTNCPQCSAELDLAEEASAFHCAYCGSSLYLAGRQGVRQYYLAPRDDPARLEKALVQALSRVGVPRAKMTGLKTVFAPYWRVKGTAYRWIFGKTRSSIKGGEAKMIKELKASAVDSTFAAFSGYDLGLPTLGVRPSALKLRFFDSKEMGRWGAVLPVSVSHQQAKDRAESARWVEWDDAEIKISLDASELIGERYSVIYFPFYLATLAQGEDHWVVILDALANEASQVYPLAKWNEQVRQAKGITTWNGFPEVQYIPFKCPVCGWDLPPNSVDLIHFCRVCRRAWEEAAGRFQEVSYHTVAPKVAPEGPLIYLPYWVFRVSLVLASQTVDTIDKFYQTFPLVITGRSKPTTPAGPIYFHIPAMKINSPLRLNKVAHAFTAIQPECQFDSDQTSLPPVGRGVYLDRREAGQMTKIVLLSLVTEGNHRLQKEMATAVLHVLDYHLALYPFFEQGLYLRDAVCGTGIEKRGVFT